MAVRQAILGILANEPVHGYELKSKFESHILPDDSLNYGQVYATLERLRRDGLVGQHLIEQDERPDKKVYSLTEAGERELREWLATPTKVELDLRNEIFLKIMVARRVGWTTPESVLHVERRACMERMHEMNQAMVRAGREGAPIQTRMLLELALLRLEANAKWFDRCEELLAKERRT